MSRVGTAKERSVFVGNIPYDVTEEMLREIFSEAGQVISFRLVTDRDTGKPKGYGFCEYADGATALSAMRNLNGYEINGRNLRVDFADGGERTGGSGGGGNGSGSGGGNFDIKGPSSGLSGETFVTAIENAIRQFGPVKLYDLLVVLKEHARQKPEVTKNILVANPALAHAIVQCFRTLHIRMSDQPGLLSAPRPGGPVPSRSPVNGAGGILGIAPPGPPIALGQPPSRMPPPPTLSAVPPPPMAQARPLSPPPPVSSTSLRARDPRARARDPRKRSSEPLEMDASSSSKRSRSDPNSESSAFDPIAELARHMTPEKLNLLPPNERQIVLDYMHSHGLSI